MARHLRGSSAPFVAALFTLLAARPATAAQSYSIAVSSGDDAASGGTGCTLRDAIGAANAGATANTAGCTLVALGSSATNQYTLNLPTGSYTYTLAGSALTITSAVTIVGDANGTSIVQAASAPGGASYGVVVIQGAGPVELRNLGIRHGSCQAGTCFDGGGVNVAFGATASLVRCSLTANQAFRGGAIYAGPVSTLTLTETTIADNTAAISGGGIYNEGFLSATGSTVTRNSADSTGAGLHNFGTLSLAGSTVSANVISGSGSGAGIKNEYGGSLTLSNCTLSGNMATFDGGAIVNEYGSVDMRFCTVTTNRANKSNTSAGGGGGFLNIGDPWDPSAGTFIIANSIVAGNTGDPGWGPDCYTAGGTLISNGHNIIQSTTGPCAITAMANPGTDLRGVDPLLGPLQNNGGTTFTHALQPGSPALGAITSNCPATDQRGWARPATCDIGAFEACGVGQISDGSACVDCTAGKYNDVPAAATCKTCDAGSFSSAGAVTCDPCAPGTYGALAGATTCKPCNAGSYSGVSAATSCTLCAVGTYSDVPGAASCKTCGAGQSSQLPFTSCYDIIGLQVLGLTPNSGSTAGGTTVVVVGGGFVAGSTNVLVDGLAPANVTVVSPNQLTLVTQPHPAGAVDVAIANGHGGMTTVSAGFTYVAVDDDAPALASIAPLAGPMVGGTIVTLTGARFASDATVSFGATLATQVTFVSATQLRAVAPAHAAGVVDVTVTNASANKSAKLGAAFTFVPAPVITSVSPAQGPTLGGTSVTVHGTNFAPGIQVTWAGLPVAAANVTTSALDLVTPAHAAGAIDVELVNPDGQSARQVGAYVYFDPAPDFRDAGVALDSGEVAPATDAAPEDSAAPDAVADVAPVIPADAGIVDTRPAAIDTTALDATLADATGIDGSRPDSLRPVDTAAAVADAQAPDGAVSAADASSPRPSDTGCSCHLGGRTPGSGIGLPLLLGLLIVWRRRARG